VSNRITGTVTGVDDSGNLITSIAATDLADVPHDNQLSISSDDHETRGLFDTYDSEPPMTVIGDSGHLELVIVGDSAKIMLGISVGTEVAVSW
jgi:S-adenosylmethionine hydrolase